MKKIIALLMVIAMLIPCAFAEEINHYKMDHEDSYKDWLQDTSPVELTVYTSNANVYEAGLSEERIAAETGISVNYVNSGDSDGTGLMLLLASGDLPDIIAYEGNADFATNFAAQAIASGAVYAYDDLIEQYAPHFFDVIAADHRNPTRWEDGKFYWMDNYISGEAYVSEMLKYEQYGTPNCSLIREDWYNEVGAPDVSTPEGFIACLQAILEKHPEAKHAWTSPDLHKNAPYDEFNNHFGLLDVYVADDGSVQHKAFDPAAREASLFMNQMYLSGVLSKDVMVTDGDEVQAQVYSGEVISYRWNAAEHGKMIDNGDEDMRYVIMQPFDSYVGYMSAATTGNRRYMISTNCEHPDRAIQLIEFMWSIYGESVLWGIQGESPANGGAFGDIVNGPHWYVDETGKPTYYPEVTAAYSADYGGTQTKIGAVNEIHGIMLYTRCCDWGVPSERNELVQKYYAGKITYIPELANVGNVYKTDPELAEIRSACNDIAKAYTAKIVYAETAEEANAQYDAMLAEMVEANVATLNDAYTAVYQANLAALAE